MGKQIHGGDIYRNVIRMDYSVNVNPLGMPEAVKELLRRSADGWACYPDPECAGLVKALGEYWETDPSRVTCGNGAADLIWQLAWAVRPKQALVLAPTFAEYERALEAAGCRVRRFLLSEEEEFAVPMGRLLEALTPDLDLVFLCNPNNPTGTAVCREEIERLAKACHHNHTLLVVDECFCELLDRPEEVFAVPLLERYPNLAVLEAFTKTYAMAGLRLGYLLSVDPELHRKLRAVRQPWCVSLPAQEAGICALKQGLYRRQTRKLLAGQRPAMKEGLKQLGCRVYGGGNQANYLLFRDLAQWGPEAGEAPLYDRFLYYGVLIRDCGNFSGLGLGYYRVCVGKEEENRRFLTLLRQIRREHGERY